MDISSILGIPQTAFTLSKSIMSSDNTHPITIQQLVTPWDVRGEVVDGVSTGINYAKLMDQFGCQPLTPQLISRFERLVGERAHPLLKRGAFYCHRDFDKMLDLFENGKQFYLYTGRGPSSESMHLGHMIPFVFCQYLQRVFKCHLVIQLTDDEKFLFKEALTLEQVQKYARDNAKDIIAAGFDPQRTFIFINSDYVARMYPTVLKVQKLINLNQAQHVFGFTGEDCVGRVSFPALQIAPSFSSAFPHLFGDKVVPCLIPYAIDQDPYFRLCRDIAPRLKLPKPASLCSIFFPSLLGHHTKMSSSTNITSSGTSAPPTAVFMTDSAREIATKINKYAFSGGRDTIELHRQLGANLEVDIAYNYLRFFLEDDDELEQIRIKYGKGEMLTGEVKARCIEVLQGFIKGFQEKRAQVTDDILEHFLSIRPVA